MQLQYSPNHIELINRIRQRIRPRVIKSVAEWADANVYLPDSSAKKGMWNTADVEFTREILEAPLDPAVTDLTVMSSAQIFKTTMLIIMNMYDMIEDPCPILILRPTRNEAEAFSKTKLQPMIDKVPNISTMLGAVSGRNAKNALLYKEYKGGFLFIVGSNSTSDLASNSVKKVYQDEIDRIPESAGLEGDPCELSENRTESFRKYGYKHIRFSTPTIDGKSRVQKKYLQSDQREYYVPCPHCGYMQTLHFFPLKLEEPKEICGITLTAGTEIGGLYWEKETDMFGKTINHLTNTAYYECENPACKAHLTELDKYYMIRNGKWIPKYPEIKNHRGYKINRLYSPISTWVQMAKKFVDVKDDPEELQPFYNTYLGECWKAQEIQQIDENALIELREPYLTKNNPAVPNGVLFLTAQTDTQADRLEVLILGWGIGEECWALHYEKLYGDPDAFYVYDQLDELLNNFSVTREDGLKLQLGGYIYKRRNLATMIDSGGKNTGSVYDYVRTRQHLGIVAIKGASNSEGKPILLNRSMVGKNKDVILQNIAVDSVKPLIFNRIKRKPGGAKTIHYPQADWCDQEFFDSLTAEHQVVIIEKRTNKKKTIWKKKKPSMRNEVWDLMVYGYANLKSLNINLDDLKTELEKKAAELKQTPPAENEETTAPAQQQQPAKIPQKKYQSRFKRFSPNIY